MNFDVEKHTILLVRHGSHAYGTNIATSDIDIKGVCIEPTEFHFGFLHRFEQKEELVHKGHPHDKVVYSLKKFAALAADCNPNIIEVLHVDSSDILQCDRFGEILRSHRNDFLSRKALHTFTGYAHAQLKKIKNKMDRNPPLEGNEKGYNTKHAMHLHRLMRMCREILRDGKVLVKRPDAAELLEIRNGLWSYEKVVEEAEKIEAECQELYKTSPLPKEPNRVKLDELVVDMTTKYLADSYW